MFVADGNYVYRADSQFVRHFQHHMFDVITFQLFTSAIVNEADFSVHFLANGMHVMYIIGEEDRIFFNLMIFF